MATQEEVNKKYKLRPNMYIPVCKTFDAACQYDQLTEIARAAFNEEVGSPETALKDHSKVFKSCLAQEDIDFFLRFLSEQNPHERHAKEILPLVKAMLTPELDTAIKQYFGSHYAVMWGGFSEVKHPDTPQRYFTKWHCDGGPTCHLKAITYLNSTSDHSSTTMLADLASTDRLKEIGYIMNDISTRQGDISDLVEAYNIDFKPERVEFDAGDTLLFNPTQRAHRAELPDEGAVRYSFTLCLVPSPIPWEELISRGLYAKVGCQPFEQFARDVMRVTQARYNNQPVSDVVELNEQSIIVDSASLLHHLKVIFKNDQYAQRLHDSITGGNAASVLNFTLHDLMSKLKSSFVTDLNWKKYFSAQDMENIQNLLAFEMQHVDSYGRYRTAGKPNKDGVMWPIPNHPKHPKNKYDMLPYVKRNKIMNHGTPIGSAGSCFAFEIAEVLQEEGFNYVVEERADNTDDGVYVDGYTAGDKYAKFSANYGLLFNTPSLKQLAEKAFGHRGFTKYCCRDARNIISDPYRENVYFASKAAYLNDYPKHIEAVRRSLINSKVFIFTAGLNECWQLHDGTVISRNPRDGFYHMLKHRVLTVEENVENIKAFIAMVREHNPDFKMILTLSPIPLLGTGRADTHHIIEANIHSKSVLRVAIDKVVSEVEDVYYLPSYEYVMECHKDAWKDDHRHVKREVVSRIISMFKEMFVE